MITHLADAEADLTLDVSEMADELGLKIEPKHLADGFTFAFLSEEEEQRLCDLLRRREAERNGWA